jgi:hypothetical protein
MSGASILVVGAGGREHAITWACAEQCASITVAPGNGGTVGSIGACKLEQSPATTVPEIVALAQQLKPELVIVGPEVPLADGLAGACSEGRGDDARWAEESAPTFWWSARRHRRRRPSRGARGTLAASGS